jgi:hypothetical protein
MITDIVLMVIVSTKRLKHYTAEEVSYTYKLTERKFTELLRLTQLSIMLSERLVSCCSTPTFPPKNHAVEKHALIDSKLVLPVQVSTFETTKETNGIVASSQI